MKGAARTAMMIVAAQTYACVSLAQDALSPVSIADIMAIRNVHDTQISPDGSLVAFVVSVPDLERNAYSRDVWLVATTGEPPFQLTNGPGRDDTPRWSPDGTSIAFLSDRAEGLDIWRIAARGGEARRLTETETGVVAFRWSPDSSSLAFLSRDAGTAAAPGGDSPSEEIIVHAPSPVVRLHVVDAASGAARPLTGRSYSVDDFSWSPDGEGIAFSARPTADVADMFNADIYTVSLASGSVSDLVTRPGADASPRWSPDGTQIAFVSNYEGQDWISNWHAFVVPVGGGPASNVSRAFDEFIIDVHWSADGKKLLFAGWQTVTTQLFELTVANGRLRQLSSGLYAHGRNVSLTADTTALAFSRSDPRTPSEVFVSSTEDFSPRRLTTTNPELDAFELGRTERLEWRSRDGLAIDGLLMLPPRYDGETRLPLLTYVHGGPAGRFGAGFSPQLGANQSVQAESFPLHVQAARGVAILLPNPRGSNGYGERFRKANRKDWGFGDYEDIVSGVDFLVGKGIADPHRLGIMGRSYGGYMTAWIITQTDRFKAASLGAAMVNLRSFYGQTDIPGYLEYYLEGDPWTAKEAYDRHSPINFADRIRTPTLIVQGESDARVPLPQAQELYRALVEHGVVVEYVVQPRQGHLTTDPRMQRDTLERNLRWFERWLRTPAESGASSGESRRKAEQP